jgi:hypothetical protein
LEGWWAASLFFFLGENFCNQYCDNFEITVFGCKFSDFWGKEIAKIRDLFIYFFYKKNLGQISIHSSSRQPKIHKGGFYNGKICPPPPQKKKTIVGAVLGE